MRILIVSTFFPPVTSGGYEVECGGVAEHLARRHDVLVLTSDSGRGSVAPDSTVRRELRLLSPDAAGARRAPAAALRAAGTAREALGFRPDLIYVWNGASIPQTAIRLLADSGTPLAFRICEHWFGGLFSRDQFLRELLPAERSPSRAAWAAGCRAVNRLPSLRLDPLAPLRAAISWNSRAIERMVETPSFIESVLERVGHSVPRYGDLFAAVTRAPAEEPEILYVGRVNAYKGVWVAIEALALLRSEHGVKARLVVVGPEEPDHAVELREMAARRGVAELIEWRGPQPPAEAAAALARAHVLIVPSVWEEPFPLVTLEGALARVPLVAADVGGISEGMHDEEHALLFERADPASAAVAVLRTLRDPEATAARVARAHERAQRFRIGPYLEAQEAFVLDAHAALSDAGG